LASFSQTSLFHVLAADVHDLLAGDVGQVTELRHRVDQVLDLKAARLVTGILALGLGAGDRAAGGENHHLRLGGQGRSRERQRDHHHDQHCRGLHHNSPTVAADLIDPFS
jgi:hypothetical protein